MKIILLFIIFLHVTNSFAQSIQNNKVNLFTLIIDYDQPVFEGGNISYYDCNDCTNDSLPFLVEYDSPGDFGGITFSLNNSQEIFFNASIIWMGEGDISYPTLFSTDNPFVEQQIPFSLPSNRKIYDAQGQISNDTQLIQYAESAWTSIESLVLIREAMENNFMVGMYLYTPEVGATNWNVAKWIVFLYKNTSINNVNQNEIINRINVFPNPALDELKLNLNLENQISYRILSLEGKKVQEAILLNSSINLNKLQTGTYFLEIFENSIKIKTIKFEKL